MITVKLNKNNIKEYCNTKSKKELLDFIEKYNKEITFVDLFCGAGGVSKGYEMAGFKPVAAVDFLNLLVKLIEEILTVKL